MTKFGHVMMALMTLFVIAAIVSPFFWDPVWCIAFVVAAYMAFGIAFAFGQAPTR